MAAAAVPVAMLAGSIGSSLIGNKASKDIAAQGREQTPEEKRAFEGGMGTAGQLGGMGSMLYGQGATNVSQAGDYYQKLLGRGGKEAAMAAVAPQAENISQIYRGVSRGLEGRNVRGGVRDLALARAGRDKAGAISRLISGVQPAAAGALSQIGTTLTSQGIGAKGAAGGIYSQLMDTATQGRGIGLQGALAGHQIGQGYGQDIGSLLFRLLSQYGGSSSGGVKGGVPPGLPPGYPKGAGLPTHPGNVPGG